MRRNLAITIGTFLLVGLIMPAGMLFGTETFRPSAVTSNSANWYYTEQASNLLNEMQTLAFKVRKEVARLQVQGDELGWQMQSDRLAEARSDVNVIGDDLVRLDHTKNMIEPWQKNLVHKVTPEIHEIVYQMDAAIYTLNAHESRTDLALTEYPQNINIIYKNANRMAGTIGTVTQYAQAEERLAELKPSTGSARS